MFNKLKIPLLLLVVTLLLPGYSAGQDEEGILQCEKISIPEQESDIIKGIGDSAMHLSPAEIFPKAGVLYNGPKSVTEKQANTTNRFASLEDMKYYNYFAHAAECPFSIRDENSPQTGGKTCTPNPIVLNDTQYCETMSDSVTDTFGMIFWNQKRNEVIAAFRGTRSLQNLMSDLHTTSFVSQKLKGVKLHDGFVTVAKIFYNSAVERINWMVKKYGSPRIIYIGHSLGGSLATLVLGMTKVNGQLPAGVEHKLITYGQPRVGNEATADYINNWGIEVSRVVANGDVVPHIPTVSSSSGTGHYVHHRNEVWIVGDETIFCTADTYEDSSCSNSLDPKYTTREHLVYWDVHYGDWLIPSRVSDFAMGGAVPNPFSSQVPSFFAGFPSG